MKRLPLLCTLVAFSSAAFAQSLPPDAQPVDVSSIMAVLKQVRDQNDTAMKTRRIDAYKRIVAASASAEASAALWKEAIKAVKFEGSDHEGSQLKNWRDGDGEALNDKFCQNAVRLHLQWLALTLQHAGGAENKQLLPQVLEHVGQLQADEVATEHFNEQIAKARERKTNNPNKKEDIKDDTVVKQMHDEILRLNVSGSPVARWLQLGELLGPDGKRRSKDANGGWESTPGSITGIFNSIILPEYRSSKDPRLLGYWDMIIKRETDRAAKKDLDVEQREWSYVKRPSLLWSRCQDLIILGQRNRAIGEMVTLIKTYPQHPDVLNWIGQIETLLTTPPTPTTPAAPAAGAVPPPTAVPTATLLPQ